MKRFIAVLVAGSALGGAAAGSRTVDTNRDKAVRRDAMGAAEAAGLRAGGALSAQVDQLRPPARSAGGEPRLAETLRADLDAATVRQRLADEAWWRPYRDEFQVYGVAFEGDRLDVIEGLTSAALATEPLVRGARERREPLAEVVTGDGRPYAAAAVAVAVTDRARPAVVVLARPIDEAALGKVAEAARGAVLLSDGDTAVIESGTEPERARLRLASETARKGPMFQPKGESWAAAASQVAPGWWLWTYASGAAASQGTERTAAATKVAMWAVAALVVVAALLFGLRRPLPSDAPLGPRHRREGGVPGGGVAGAQPAGGTASGRAAPPAGAPPLPPPRTR